MSEDDVKIRDYVDTRINELARTLDYRMSALSTSIDERFTAMIRAVDKAEASMNARLEGMNEFRDQLKDQTGTFATRAQQDQNGIAIYTRMDDLRTQMETAIRAQGERFDGMIGEQGKAVDILRSTSDKREGASLRVAAAIAFLPTIIAVLALIATWINRSAIMAQ